jgi:phosphoribosylaminoimidazole (AIR) synthetase
VFDTVGIDLVAMNVNDLIVQGAEPLFFLDYIAVPKVDKAMLNAWCAGSPRVQAVRLRAARRRDRQHARRLRPRRVRPRRLLRGRRGTQAGHQARPRAPGDVVLGLASSGVHSNGYSLVRKVVSTRGWTLVACTRSFQRKRQRAKRSRAPRRKPNGNGSKTLGEVLLTPTRLYADSIVRSSGPTR